jgi:hypothetical protein
MRDHTKILGNREVDSRAFRQRKTRFFAEEVTPVSLRSWE